MEARPACRWPARLRSVPPTSGVCLSVHPSVHPTDGRAAAVLVKVAPTEVLAGAGWEGQSPRSPGRFRRRFRPACRVSADLAGRPSTARGSRAELGQVPLRAEVGCPSSAAAACVSSGRRCPGFFLLPVCLCSPEHQPVDAQILGP